MAGLFSPAGVPKGVRSSPLVTKEPSDTPNSAGRTGASFPKSFRILRSSEFRTVYQNGFRVAGPYFAAFCLASAGGGGPRVGFTTPRALGNSVVRNRIKRRLREAVRLRLNQLGSDWVVVFNPRKGALTAPFQDLVREVEKVFLRCGS
jgi:ribonuclease P protein component